MEKVKVYYPGRKGYAVAKRKALREPEAALWWWRTLSWALAYEAEVMQSWLSDERNRTVKDTADQARVVHGELARLRDEADSMWQSLKLRHPDAAAAMEARLNALITQWGEIDGCDGSWFAEMDWPKPNEFGSAESVY